MKITTAVSLSVLMVAVAVVPLEALGDHMKAFVSVEEVGCHENNECFVPYVTTVDAGGEVIWVNNDSRSHRIISGADDVPDGTFDSGTIGPGERFSFKFEEPGEYTYYSPMYQRMSGIIVVESIGSDDHDAANTESADGAPSATAMLSDGAVIEVYSTEPMAGEPVTVKITFVDREEVNFGLLVSQNGDTVFEDEFISQTGVQSVTTLELPSGDPLDIEITFLGYGTDEMTGPVGEMAVFERVVPEFGTLAAVILAVAVVAAVAVSAKSGLGIVPRY